MEFHPNGFAVECQTEEDVKSLAEQMKAAAVKDIDKCVYAASSTEKEARRIATQPVEVDVSNGIDHEVKVKVKTLPEEMIEKGILRFIFWKDCDKPINLVFTLREDEDLKQEWNLSMSHGTHQGPQRVDDDIANIIANAFLDSGWQEVEPKAFWNNVRHFIKDKS